MVVILKVRVVPETFALGRVVPVPERARIELETLVTRGERSQPYLWVVAPDVETTVATIRERTSVDLTVVEVIEDRALLALDWDIERGDLFSGIRACDGRILAVTGARDGWEFDVRFPEHAALLEFKRYCEDHDIDFTVKRIYYATRPTVDDSFGLTERQREALELAVREGYYAVPRRCRTADLAERFDISEQALLERLRRGIVNLVSATLLPSEPDR
ncbi:helix-turn-helix domain-containing protein [Halalkalicoccus sp. GCM10025322]|uniref:helix-turn-helix domain-containing protein n=1 Tax=Halalkalicoccus TaxID=332246 RepID=UPI002F965FA5